MKAILIAAFFSLLASTVQAQTPPVIATSQLAWDQQNVGSAAEAQAFTYTMYEDGSTLGTPLTGVTCSGSPIISCRAPFPAFAPGPHTLNLTASNIAGESLHSLEFPFIFVVVPSAPKNLRIE